MIGFSSFSDYAISDFPFIAFVPPPPLQVSGTDGFSREEIRRYQELQKKLDNAVKARDRARRTEKENLRLSVARQVDPDKYPTPKPETEKPAEPSKPKRSTLQTKPLAVLEANVMDLQAQQHQLRYEAWQRAEHARLVAMELRRAQERDDEDALLAIL